MQDNSTDYTADMLIRYIDDELTPSEREAAEKLLRTDVSAQERYEYFLAARRAIKAQGLKQKVASIQQEFLTERKETKEAPVVTMKSRSAFKTWMSVAAILFFLIAGYGVFQFTSTTPQSVYDDAYLAYQLPVNRGNEKVTDMDALYNNGNYSAVVRMFEANPQKTQKDYFLAAQSYLQLNNAAAAIVAFQQVEHLNTQNNQEYFAPETDYYLMLAYIKAGKIEAAQQRLDKILADKNHLFYSKASTISRTKLTMLKWKEK